MTGKRGGQRGERARAALAERDRALPAIEGWAPADSAIGWMRLLLDTRVAAGLPPSVWGVVIALVRHATVPGGRGWSGVPVARPSVGLIARETGLGASTIDARLVELARLGAIRGTPRPGSSTVWTLNAPVTASSEPPQNSGSLHPEPPQNSGSLGSGDPEFRGGGPQNSGGTSPKSGDEEALEEPMEEGELPSPFCALHPSGTAKPCHGCGVARERHKAAARAQAEERRRAADAAQLSELTRKVDSTPEGRARARAMYRDRDRRRPQQTAS